MAEPNEKTEQASNEPVQSVTERQSQTTANMSMEDEEKIMAGHTDVNMTSVLTKDVPGG